MSRGCLGVVGQRPSTIPTYCSSKALSKRDVKTLLQILSSDGSLKDLQVHIGKNLFVINYLIYD